jgi:H+/Cl- antiporter ClcA
MQVCAGAVMCGVTRLSVSLVIILFEMTGSLDHVLPFSLAVLVSKWTADAIEPLSIYVGFRTGIPNSRCNALILCRTSSQH